MESQNVITFGTPFNRLVLVAIFFSRNRLHTSLKLDSSFMEDGITDSVVL
jgi:hypothetical protein